MDEDEDVTFWEKLQAIYWTFKLLIKHGGDIGAAMDELDATIDYLTICERWLDV